MTKEELIKYVSEKADLTQAKAKKSIEAVVEGVSSTLKKGEAIVFQGFGSFKIVDRAARHVRDFKTGEKIKIAARKAVKFSPSKVLKEIIQKHK